MHLIFIFAPLAASDSRTQLGLCHCGSLKETWFDGKRPKSPFMPLYNRGKPNICPPLCKGETEGILFSFEPSFSGVSSKSRQQGVSSGTRRDRVGGGLTPSVLPHQRTYGSVYGGSWFMLNQQNLIQ